MNPTAIFRDDDAVSPVIGVILMVAITVILAAVIGAFVLGITGQESTAPQGAWDVSAIDTDDNRTIDEVRFQYDAGEQLQRENLGVSIPENETDLGTGSITAGSTIVVALDESDKGSAGDELHVLWTDEGSDESAVIVRHSFQSEYGDDFASVTVE